MADLPPTLPHNGQRDVPLRSLCNSGRYLLQLWLMIVAHLHCFSLLLLVFVCVVLGCLCKLFCMVWALVKEDCDCVKGGASLPRDGQEWLRLQPRNSAGDCMPRSADEHAKPRRVLRALRWPRLQRPLVQALAPPRHVLQRGKSQRVLSTARSQGSTSTLL